MNIRKVLLILLSVIGVFKIVEGACWLLSQKSTLFNIAGFLVIVGIFIIIPIILFKKQKQHEK